MLQANHKKQLLAYNLRPYIKNVIGCPCASSTVAWYDVITYKRHFAGIPVLRYLLVETLNRPTTAGTSGSLA